MSQRILSAGLPFSTESDSVVLIDTTGRPYNEPTPPIWYPMTLVNGWYSYESGYAPISYSVSAFGLIRLRGLIRGGAVGQVSADSQDYAPEYPCILTTFGVGSAGQVPIRVDVVSSGALYLSTNGIDLISLDGISYQRSTL